jgi:transposase
MMLNRTEKEKRVIELYQQGKTIREIAQDVHMSFGDIASIKKKVTGLCKPMKNRKRKWYEELREERTKDIQAEMMMEK